MNINTTKCSLIVLSDDDSDKYNSNSISKIRKARR